MSNRHEMMIGNTASGGASFKSKVITIDTFKSAASFTPNTFTPMTTSGTNLWATIQLIINVVE